LVLGGVQVQAQVLLEVVVLAVFVAASEIVVLAVFVTAAAALVLAVILELEDPGAQCFVYLWVFPQQLLSPPVHSPQVSPL
jgi:hypothetical protein